MAYAIAELDAAFNDHLILIVDRRDGQPLLPDSGPLQIVVPQDKRPARWIRAGDDPRGQATAMTELLTVRAAAERLGVAYSTLKQWIYDGSIRTTTTRGGHHASPRPRSSVN